MRVVFLTDSLSDLDGVGRYTVRLIQAMERLRPGLGVEVLLARKHRPTSDAVPAHWDVRVALPPDYFYYMAPTRFWPSLAQGAWHTWRAARKADIVHAIKDFPHSLVGVLGARAAGVPCVATGHGTYTVQPLLSERHAKLARWTYRKLDGMISVSDYTRRRLLAVLDGEALAPEDVRVIPNCVDAEHYAERREVGAQPWHGKRYLLGIGEMKERKGVHLALGAFLRVAEAHPDLHHFFVGKLTEDDYLAGLRRLVSEAGLESRVHFLGNVTEDEKIDLLQGAEVFVHTPVTAADGGFEGFGIVYLEASACGVPVLGTRDCGAEDAIDHERTGLLADQTPEAVTAALERLLGDGAARASMGRQGLLRAAESSWTENARQVLELYDAVLA